MDFSWSEEQLDLSRRIREFGRKELNDEIVQRDRAGTFPRDNWNKCAAFGIHGLTMPEEFGGSQHDALTAALAMEALGYGCRDNGLIFAINAQIWAVQMPLLNFGNQGQKQFYLPSLISGKRIGAHAITEPSSGSDVFSLRTHAAHIGNKYVLQGTKTFVSNAPTADLFLVFATVDKRLHLMGITAFLIEKGTPGLAVSKPMEKMGLRTAPLAELILEDCQVPEENRLSLEGNGAAVFRYAMGWERSCILASYLGMMERQLERSLEYVCGRKQFGQLIGSFQSVSNRIVDMKLRLETARLLLYRAVWLRAQGHEAMEEVAMAKLHLSESAVQSALDAIQVHGGYGYMVDFEFERELRDAIGTRLYSGTSEIQRNIIAQTLGLPT